MKVSRSDHVASPHLSMNDSDGQNEIVGANQHMFGQDDSCVWFALGGCTGRHVIHSQ